MSRHTLKASTQEESPRDMENVPGATAVDHAILEAAMEAKDEPAIDKWTTETTMAHPPPITVDEFVTMDNDLSKRNYELLDQGKLSWEEWEQVNRDIGLARRFGIKYNWKAQSEMRELLHKTREKLDEAENRMDMSVSD